MRIRQIFIGQNTNLDTFLTKNSLKKNENFDEMLSKKGEIVENWL